MNDLTLRNRRRMIPSRQQHHQQQQQQRCGGIYHYHHHSRISPMVTLVLVLLYVGNSIIQLPTTFGRDIPTKKAMPPLMDPIPILPEITHRIYMDITIQGRRRGKDEEEEGEQEKTDDDSNHQQSRTGRIVIGLFGKNAPTAAENFRLLSTCTNQYPITTDRTPITTTTKNILCYKDTILHRIIPNFAIQGGDTTHGNGIGGRAAIDHHNHNHNGVSGTYQPYMINTTHFNRPYMVAVATPNTQLAKSQFFITTTKAQWLTELQYTIFGMVLEGREYIHTIETMAGTYGGRPNVKVQIVDCGEVPLEPYDTEPHY